MGDLAGVSNNLLVPFSIIFEIGKAQTKAPDKSERTHFK